MVSKRIECLRVMGLVLAGLVVMQAAAEGAQAQRTGQKAAAPVRRITRIFWQDRSSATLKWGDVYSGEAWTLKPAEVSGFPKLDAARQNLVQMKQSEGLLLVGVRDDDSGKFQSGWVAVDTGVRAVSHGNHFDWKYQQAPAVKTSTLNAEQGNPAHLYLYDGAFVMANDSRNGFTWLSPGGLLKGTTGTGVTRFYSGGGNHITLAAVGNTVCYATWIDGGGPNKGRVDVVNLRSTGSEPAYSFHLPSGVIHGATVNSGRVFFAPEDGVCWVNADPGVRLKTEADVRIEHLSLGKDEESGKALRTGAFNNHRNWVLFTTGPAEHSALCLIDAKAAKPEIIRVPLEVKDGFSLVSPEVVLAAGGKRYAFVFEDRAEGDLPEELNVIDLDPNGDRVFSDAKLVKTFTVGASRVEGHHGHHSIAFDDNHRYAFIANPGDSTIQVLSLADLEIKGTIKTEGAPEAILAIGAVEHHH